MTRGFASPTLRVVPLVRKDLDYPWWLPWGTTAAATLVALEALRHRADEWGTGSLNLAIPMLALAVAPFWIDLAGHYARRLLLPRLVWAIPTLVGVTVVLVDSPTQTDMAPFLFVMLAIQGASTATTWEAMAMSAAAAGAMLGLEAAGEFDGSMIWAFGIVSGFAGGFAVRKSVEIVTVERAAMEARTERAATEERQRIAREIHDVIAHSLSVTLLHLTGARRSLETDGDTDEAVGALRDAERLGREAMNDIRRTVGLLQPDAGGETAPTPGLADVEALCGEFARAGVDVECEIAGDPDGVSLATGLGLYRIAQESLANAARHAPGAPVTLTVDVAADPVTMAVHNRRANGQAPAKTPEVGGLGLKGIEERVRLLGGTCRFGPEADGWSVQVSVPREAEVA